MRLLCIKVLACVSVTTLGNPQGGFLSGISGAFNNIFGGSSNNNQPPPPQRRPLPQQQFQQQQFSPQPQQQQQFAPQQQFVPQQQQQFVPQPQQQFVSQPQQQQPPQFRPQTQSVSAPAPLQNAVSGGTALCGAQAPNHFWTDPRDNVRRGYVVTWKFGCSSFPQNEAKAYCNSMGMEPVSLDSPAKQDEFNRLIASDAQRFFWTGGIVDHSQKTVFWSNGRAQPVPFSQSAHWSHTGGADKPQPDNRAAAEEGIQESCLGILNNFYADGIKWHDVACHHKKPTVCEPRS